MCEVQQAGWIQSFPAGSACGDGLGGYGITLASTDLDSGNDFGNFQKATKTGMKFDDLNANGVKDAGEPGLPGWTINAFVDVNGNGTKDAADTVIAASDMTNAGGVYTLSLNPGSYVVCEVQQSGWIQSFPANTACGAAAGGWGITLISGQRDVDNDFGNWRAASKTGVKFHDLNGDGVKDAGEPGLPGWTINAYADTNGNGTRDLGEDTIAATGATGAGGAYSLTLNPGKYVVCEVQQDGWIQSYPANVACGPSAGGWGITLTSGQLDSDNDFGNFQRATKSGMKFHDLNANGVKDAGELGLLGWTITAYVDANGNGVKDALDIAVAASTVTGAGGAYSLSLLPGKYIVCETQQAGWTQSYPANEACGAAAGGWGITLTSGQLDSDNDFGNWTTATKTGVKFHDLNGDGVKDAGEPGLPGWTINAYVDANGNGVRDLGENTIATSGVTDLNGVYTLTLNPGKYVVCEAQQAGWIQSFPAGSACGDGLGGYGITPGLERARLRQRLRQLPEGHEDRHEVQRPERQRREGRRRAGPRRLDDQRVRRHERQRHRVTRARTRSPAPTRRTRAASTRMSLNPGKYVVLRGAAGHVDPVLPVRHASARARAATGSRWPRASGTWTTTSATTRRRRRPA